MQVLAKCPECGAGLPVEAGQASRAIKCRRCGTEIALDISSAVRNDTAVDRCPVCQGGDFYILKDFDPTFGVAFVATAAVISATFYWYRHDFIAYGILAAAALIDLIIYGRSKDLTVCYRCHSEFRGKYPRTAKPFDLHTADVLEQEYERRIGRR